MNCWAARYVTSCACTPGSWPRATQDYLAETQQRIDQGYDTIKMCVTDEMGWVDNVRKVHAAAEKVACIRDRFGYDIDIAVDFHGRVHMPMARMLMKELEPFGLLYIEEPLQPEQIEGVPRTSQSYLHPHSYR